MFLHEQTNEGDGPGVRGQGRGAGGAAVDTPPQDGGAAEGETSPPFVVSFAFVLLLLTMSVSSPPVTTAIVST